MHGGWCLGRLKSFAWLTTMTLTSKMWSGGNGGWWLRSRQLTWPRTFHPLRRRRIILGIVAVAVVADVAQAIIRNDPLSDDDPTPATVHFAWELHVLGDRDKGHVRFDVDQDRDVVRVRSSSDDEFFVIEGRAIVPLPDQPDDADGPRFVAIPIDEVLPSGAMVSPEAIAPSLSRRPRQCTDFSSTEYRCIRIFLERRPPAGQNTFRLCGTGTVGGAFADGENIRAVEEYRTSAIGVPDEGAIVDVAELGAAGEAIVQAWKQRLQD